MLEIPIIVAFLAGLVSFLSPCVLPIVPGFLAYLSGTSLENPGPGAKMAIFINSIFFVLGFSFVFALLGVLLNSVLANVAYDVQIWLSRIGGTLVIFFGLYLVGLIKIPFLEKEHKINVTKKFNSKYITSLVFGAAFAVGWTPCVGAALGAILGFAASAPGSAFILLMVYSLGLGLPFIIVGLFAAQSVHLIERYASSLHYINIAFGILLIALGVLVFTQSLNLIANFGLLNAVLLR